jgi:hypothetical protein
VRNWFVKENELPQRDISRTLCAPGILGKVAPVLAIFMF